MVDTLDEMFVHGLQHAYYAEQQLVEALDDLESNSTGDDIEQAFSEHKSETQTHVDRLEGVFDAIGESPETAEDPAVDGIVQAYEEFVSQDPDDHVLDRFNLIAGQKTEHYEIAAYGNLIPIADELGYDDVADTLEANLREEQDALDELSELSEGFDYGQIPTQ